MLRFDIRDIDLFVFDFDGVLTDNLVQVNQDGKESVSCNRSDGLAFDLLRKIKKPVYILSSEKNPIVTSRANKLQIPAIQGVNNKVKVIYDLAKIVDCALEKICYIGNDLNDYSAMQLCGLRACPVDSHSRIRKISNIKLKTKGGHGVVRELLEDSLGLDFVDILYNDHGSEV